MVSMELAIRKAETKAMEPIINELDRLNKFEHTWWVKVAHASEEARGIYTYLLPVRYAGRCSTDLYFSLVDKAKELEIKLHEKARKMM